MPPDGHLYDSIFNTAFFKCPKYFCNNFLHNVLKDEDFPACINQCILFYRKAKLGFAIVRTMRHKLRTLLSESYKINCRYKQ